MVNMHVYGRWFWRWAKSCLEVFVCRCVVVKTGRCHNKWLSIRKPVCMIENSAYSGICLLLFTSLFVPCSNCWWRWTVRRACSNQTQPFSGFSAVVHRLKQGWTGPKILMIPCYVYILGFFMSKCTTTLILLLFWGLRLTEAFRKHITSPTFWDLFTPGSMIQSYLFHTRLMQPAFYWLLFFSSIDNP